MATTINLNDFTPSAPAGRVNIKWQHDVLNPENVSAYMDIATGTTAGAVILAGDFGGTATSPQVISTHLSIPLPVAQGGTGINNAPANTALMGPASGGAAPPTFRHFTTADLTSAVFGPSGPLHSTGLVPDPGVVAGTTRFLREDATWEVASATPAFGPLDAIQVAGIGGAFYGDSNFTYTPASGSPVSIPMVSLTGILTFQGSSSGSASLGVAAVAGTPPEILLPITAGTVGQVLGISSIIGSPPSVQQTSWITPPSSGIGGGPGSSIVSTKLLTAATYAILGASGVTNSDGSNTSISGGNIGSYPTNTIVPGIPPWTLLNGATVVVATAQNQTDLANAIVYFQGLASTPIGASYATTTFTATPTGYNGGPGFVGNASSTLLFTGGIVTLDGAGLSNPVFVFQVGSALNVTTAATTINLINGAIAANVVWVVGSTATFDAHNHAWAGNILAHTSITLDSTNSTPFTTFNGRALANTGAVTISDAVVITVPSGGSSIIANQVAVGSGTNTIVGSPALTFASDLLTVNGDTNGGIELDGAATAALTLKNTTLATEGGSPPGVINQNSPILALTGQALTGSPPTSTPDTWTIQNVLGPGVNPTSNLTIAHSGSGGTPSIVIDGSVHSVFAQNTSWAIGPLNVQSIITPTGLISFVVPTVTSASNASAGLTTYAWTVGASTAVNITPGMYFTIAGFTNAGNNGRFQVATQPTATTLVLYNSGGVSESASASATIDNPYAQGGVWQCLGDLGGGHYTINGTIFGINENIAPAPNEVALAITTLGDATDSAYLRIINTNPATGNHGLEIGAITDGTGATPTQIQLGDFGGGTNVVVLNNPAAAPANAPQLWFSGQTPVGSPPVSTTETWKFVPAFTGTNGTSTFSINQPTAGGDLHINTNNLYVAGQMLASTSLFTFSTGAAGSVLATSSVAMSVGNLATYQVTIPGGGQPHPGQYITFAGFTTSANNGRFIIFSVTGTTAITVYNPGAVSETHAATATIDANYYTQAGYDVAITYANYNINGTSYLSILGLEGLPLEPLLTFNVKGNATDSAYFRNVTDGPTGNHFFEYGVFVDGPNGQSPPNEPAALQMGYLGGQLAANFTCPLILNGASNRIITVPAGSPPSTTYTTTLTDYSVLVNSSTAFTVILNVTGIVSGRIYRVKNLSIGTVTVQSQVVGSPPVSANIDGLPTYSIPTQMQSAEFQWDGTSWWVF
jgi:Ice-binding-like